MQGVVPELQVLGRGSSPSSEAHLLMKGRRPTDTAIIDHRLRESVHKQLTGAFTV